MNFNDLNNAIDLFDEMKALEELRYYISDPEEKLISGFKVCLKKQRQGADKEIYKFRTSLCEDCKAKLTNSNVTKHMEEAERHLLNLPVTVNKLIKGIIIKKLDKMINNIKKEFEDL
jgi:hypothetical protein